MKRMAALLLALALLLPALPARAWTAAEQTAAAQQLTGLGLMRGTGAGLELERAPTREEAAVLLLRLLGQEGQAAQSGGAHPFTDVAAWADDYVGWAYQAGLIQGVSPTRFGAGRAVTGREYLVLLLRALGYDDGADFTWQSAPDAARAAGLTDGMGTDPDGALTRGQAAVLALRALDAPTRDGGLTLRQQLEDAGLIPEGGQAPTAQAIAQACTPAVFYLQCYASQEDQAAGLRASAGSGFFLSADGVAVTNFHVVEGARCATVTTAAGGVYPVTGLIWADPERDVAVLRVGGGTDFPCLTARGEAPVSGERVYAIGAPLGLQGSFADGLVSHPGRELPGEEGYPYIQTTVPLSHGSSGGPLLDARGQVIGIATAGLSEGDSLNLAVPISCLAGVDLTGPGESFDQYYQRLADQCRLTVSPAAATVPAGGEVVLRAAHNLPGEWELSAQVADASICYLQWTDSEESAGGYTLCLAGRRPGVTTVTLTGTGMSGAITRTVQVRITVTAGRADGYADFPTVPDPARLWGAAPAGRSDSGALFYDGAALAAAAGENYFAAYRQKLEQAGFFLTGYGVDAGTGAPLLLLDNADTGQRVSLGLTAGGQLLVGPEDLM